MGLSYHTEASYVNGPWNYTSHHPVEEGLIEAMGDAYAGTSSYNVVFGWDTLTYDSLGDEDGYFYSLSPGGSLTLDMGADTNVGDISGSDFRVISGTGSVDIVSVSVATNQNGPFVNAASGSGNLDVDLSATGIAQARYIRPTLTLMQTRTLIQTPTLTLTLIQM